MSPDTPSEKAEAREHWNGGLCEYGCEGECESLQHWRDRFAYARAVIESMEARVAAVAEECEASARHMEANATRYEASAGVPDTALRAKAQAFRLAAHRLRAVLSTSPDTGCPECGSPDPADRWGSNYDCRNKFHDPTPPDTETRGDGPPAEELTTRDTLLHFSAHWEALRYDVPPGTSHEEIVDAFLAAWKVHGDGPLAGQICEQVAAVTHPTRFCGKPLPCPDHDGPDRKRLHKLLTEIRDDLYDLDGDPRLMQREDTESVVCDLDRAIALAEGENR